MRDHESVHYGVTAGNQASVTLTKAPVNAPHRGADDMAHASSIEGTATFLNYNEQPVR